MSNLSKYAVYTTIAPERLEEASHHEPSDPLTERNRWVSAKALLDEASAKGEDLPIIFSNSRHCSELVYWAVLREILVGSEKTTSFRFSRLAPIQGHSTQELVLRGSGQHIAPDFIRPYALCETPPFLDEDGMADIVNPRRAFTVDEYVAALRAATMSPHHLRMLQAHYHSEDRTLTATQMSRILGYPDYRSANLHYGTLGRLVGERLEWVPLPKQTVAVLCTFERPDHEWHWTMRPAVARAVEQLGWASEEHSELPGEIESTVALYEGAVRTVTVNAYERSTEAREKCILHYGSRCSVCGLALAEKYGDIAQGMIHVHHVRQLSEVGVEYQVDPIRDLRPVCPTCHAVIHAQKPPFAVDEVKEMIERQKKSEGQPGYRDSSGQTDV
jgi:5-methylcytosine-specific restriction enzyme A